MRNLGNRVTTRSLKCSLPWQVSTAPVPFKVLSYPFSHLNLRTHLQSCPAGTIMPNLQMGKLRSLGAAGTCSQK